MKRYKESQQKYLTPVFKELRKFWTKELNLSNDRLYNIDDARDLGVIVKIDLDKTMYKDKNPDREIYIRYQNDPSGNGKPFVDFNTELFEPDKNFGEMKDFKDIEKLKKYLQGILKGIK